MTPEQVAQALESVKKKPTTPTRSDESLALDFCVKQLHIATTIRGRRLWASRVKVAREALVKKLSLEKV
jgi:hypothetical protein